MHFFVKNLIGGLFLPPCNLLIVQAGGVLLLLRRRSRLGLAVVTLSTLGLAAVCSPAICGWFAMALERSVTPLDLDDPKLAERADAIVVLGGGKNVGSQDYGMRDMVSTAGLLRLRYAMDIERRTHKPILLTGGSPTGYGPPEAALMNEALQEEWGTKAKWLEERSANTAENAEFSYQILAPLGIRRIFLVTHAWHMPRAYRTFTKAGFQCVAAPTGFLSDEAGTSLLDLLPDSKGLDMSYLVFHEGVGALWYRLRGAE